MTGLHALRRGLALASLALVFLPSSAAPEISLSLSAGTASTFNTRVELSRPAGTDLDFDPVSWSSESFRSPIYYAVRILYWPGAPTESGWGFGVDFVHIKMFASLDDTVGVRGTRDGSPVDGRERLGDTFSTLSVSHGHNLLLATALYRWVVNGTSNSFWRRLRPYVGLGVGFAIPHGEVVLEGASGEPTDEYQLSGPALQGLTGMEVSVIRPLAVFVEGKLTYANLSLDLNGGGELVTHPWTAQFAFGLTVGLPLGS